MDREEYIRLQHALKKHLSYNDLVDISASTGLPIAPPIRACIKVTSRCNSDCVYCPYARSQSWKRVDMPLETLLRAIDSLAELGVRLCFIDGGEPLLRGDIADICAHAAQRGMTVQISTNGLLLTKEIALKLSEAGLMNLIMSLDSLEEDVYSLHRGVRNPHVSECLDILAFFAQLKPENFSAVTFVVSQKNIQELPHFVRYIEEVSHGHIGVNIQPFHDSEYSRNPELRPASTQEAEWKEIMEQVISLKRDGCHINVSEEYLRHIPAFMIHNAPTEGPCLSGFTGFFVNENLDVFPCGRLPAVGNLADISALDIWLSDNYQEARKKMLRRHCANCMLMCHTGLGDWANYLYKPYYYKLLSK